jgi:hypothetical protein
MLKRRLDCAFLKLSSSLYFFGVHATGECAGLPFKAGNRMATMVLYCTVPEAGGHTNFRNSGVHVKPKTGNGIFFSYIDPETLTMDNGTLSYVRIY